MQRRSYLLGTHCQDADVHVRALFAKSLSRDTQIVVVNPDTHDAFQARYGYLAERVSFLNQTFDSFVLSESLGEILKVASA